MLLALLASLFMVATASGQVQNLISGAQNKVEKGDFFIDTGESLAAHLAVVRGADDEHVKPAGDQALDFLGFCIGDTNGNEKKDHLTSSYFTADDGAGALGDNVAVESGGVRFAYLADGESVTMGQKAVCAANGEVRAYLDQNDATPDDPAAIIGEFAETIDNSAGGAPAPIALEVYA